MANIIDKLNMDQREGIFQVPLEVGQHMGLKQSLDWAHPESRDPSKVVEGESYYRSGITVKLNMGERGVNNLAQLGLLRPRKSEEFGYKGAEPVSTLSLAQTISWMHQTPIEDVLISEDDFEDKEFTNKESPERVRILFDAYKGCRWFEIFRLRQKRVALKRPAPQVKAWHRISRQSLTDMFLGVNVSYGHYTGIITRLCEKGFLIPAEREFVSRRDNIVDNSALAQLIALLYNVELDNVLDSDDKYIRNLTSSYFFHKLAPFLREHNIKPQSKIKILEASHLIGKHNSTIYAAGKRGYLPITYSKIEPNYVKGIDLAMYALKHTEKMAFTPKEVAQLFGVEHVNFDELGFFPSESGQYSSYRHVFPAYDMIATRAKKMFMNPDLMGSEPIESKNGLLFMSANAQQKYCREYGLPRFDVECIDHVTGILNNGAKFSRSEIQSDGTIMKLKGKIITDFRLIA